MSLPTLGDGLNLTTSQERKLGDRIIRELYRDPDYIDDAVLNEYLRDIFMPLMTAAGERGELTPELQERFAWQILLGRDRTVNAFALPGGYFGVHLGLIAVVSTRDELASVMAHELSHVTQRHISRLIAQQEKMTPLMIGSMILGALAASRNPGAAQALIVGGQAVAAQSQLNFSRDMEREADRIGYGLMAPAGFAPLGFVSMFEKLQAANRINDNGSWPYLRSHPLTTQRISDMRSRIGGDGAVPQPSLDHVMMSARARVLMRPGVDVWRQWVREPQDVGFSAHAPSRQVAGWYAAALSAVQLQDWSAARSAVTQLQGMVSGNAPAMRQVRLLAAEVALASGDASAALHALGDGASGAKAIAGRPELMLRAQAQLQLKQAAAVSGPLQTWVTANPGDAAAWQLLAQAWQQQNQPLRAVRAEAEAQVARYDYSAALDRFKAGQDLSREGKGDFYEASIIDTRLRAIASLFKEQTAER